MLAICLGLQLLAEGSEESPGVAGLGVIAGRAARLPDSVRVPHLGWNSVSAETGALVESGFAAYANSYALANAPDGWTVTRTQHGIEFVASLERGSLLATQFHPELSGSWGRDLLARWLCQEPGRGRNVSRLTSHGSRLTSHVSRLAQRIIPCLDVANGRIVKGVKFQNLRDAGDPAERAAEYERQGADEIVILDIAASPEGRATQAETVRRVRSAIHIPLTVGGGVRSVADAARLLAAGADKVSVNTAAVSRPELLEELAQAFGCQCVVLAVDAQEVLPSAGAVIPSAGEGSRIESCVRADHRWERTAPVQDPSLTLGMTEWRVLTNGGRTDPGRSVIDWLRTGTSSGAGEILLTSWDRDGTRSGADLDLLRAASAAVSVPVIASGGIGVRQDIADAFDAGADAVLAASIFHDGDDTVAGVKQWLTERGYEVRP